MNIDLLGFPYKESVQIEDWEGDFTAEELDAKRAAGEEPSTVVTLSDWFEADGTKITDPDRILALEASIAERK